MSGFEHKSIMLRECIEGLAIKPGGVYVDGTLGAGGHSEAILKRLGKDGTLYGIDLDETALEAAGARLSAYASQAHFLHGNFKDMVSMLKSMGVTGADGIMLDLGVSSPQLDDAERGFSYMKDARLDMRMDRTQALSAYEVVNGFSREELTRIIRDFGEDRFAPQIAQRITRERAITPIETTLRLSYIITSAIPARYRRTGPHPAKRTFQAIRIAVNGELDSLEEAIAGMIDFLNEDGRLCVITFHSLEDRAVKNAMKKAENPCECPKDFPICVCGKKPLGQILMRKPAQPSEAELEENPRSRSAKLRIFARAGRRVTNVQDRWKSGSEEI